MNINHLEAVSKSHGEFYVKHKPDLAQKYLGKFVTWLQVEESDDFQIINKNQSVRILCNNECVGAVIRDIAKQDVMENFGRKMMLTTQAHYKINRGQKTHADSGKLVGYGPHAEFLNPNQSTTYAYAKKNLDPEEQKIRDEDGDSFGKWLYENAHNYLRWTMKSYEEFKKKISLEDEELIGAVFCAENYEAVGHKDNDRSEWAVGFCYDYPIPIKKGYFIYPEYGIAIEMTTNSLWCWKTKCVHGTATLDLNGGTRYTSAITLTEKTAKAMEKERGL